MVKFQLTLDLKPFRLYEQISEKFLKPRLPALVCWSYNELGFTQCKARQPLKGIELQEIEIEKKYFQK